MGQNSILLGTLLIGLVTQPTLAFCETVFSDEFDQQPAGEHPAVPPWRAISDDPETRGTARVIEDTDNLFGKGVENQFLRFQDTGGSPVIVWADRQIANGPTVFTVSFDFHEPLYSPGNRFVLNLYNDDTSSAFTGNRIQRLQFEGGSFRDFTGTFYSQGITNRIQIIVNSGSAPISYHDGDMTIPAATADVWINGERELAGYQDSTSSHPGPLAGLDLRAYSNAPVTMYIDDLRVQSGVALGEEGAPPESQYSTWVFPGENERLEYATDSQGDRIPDFSNAGYMGGGVAIPDVPTRYILSPLPSGDDTVRIQQAINQVAAMELDDNGFRGAVLLRAGEYRIGGQLRIRSSGTVLHGEGDGESGTVLRATGTSRRTLIDVRGSGSLQEIPDTRQIIDADYVPVGADTIPLGDTSPFSPGDTVIVHRPSTAEWISTIGMDSIPERHDDLEVNQWQAGEFDIPFDRIVTEVTDSAIRIDAPVVNAIETRFGGGWVYRYSHPGRITQVGVQNLRGVSDYTHPEDEEHSWRMVEFNNVQNGWAGHLTGQHFSFGTVYIGRSAKWITVEESSNLDPISEITGSRRYPFYVGGQLNLVQNCYAHHARHDYGTNSRTVGPNVFYNSVGENSYSDTGPHHRWSTGSLYDNMNIPDSDINVQNRLNFGSGHGWAGANHVVWNSIADRIAVQNPPTAQNWAIGVKGHKWAGHFPDYAEDGIWESLGTHVKPESLYQAQLLDRLAPEGKGGAISLVEFADNGPSDPREFAGDTVEIPLRRTGILDGSTTVHFTVHGEGSSFITPIDPVYFPARTAAGPSLTLTLAENVRSFHDLPLTLKIAHGPAYSPGEAASADLIIPANPFEAWRHEHFSQKELEDPEISAPDAAPAKDGLPNLFKHLMGLAPHDVTVSPLSPIQRDGLPAWKLPVAEEATDVRLSVEVSSDLVNWQRSDGEFVIEHEEKDEESFLIIKVSPTHVAPRSFIRLRAELE